MYPQVLKRFRDRVRDKRYVVTIHAQEEMEDDGLTIYDVEHVILTGEIVERQKDAMLGGWKYLVQGATRDDRRVVVASKIGPTDKLVIITMYLSE